MNSAWHVPVAVPLTSRLLSWIFQFPMPVGSPLREAFLSVVTNVYFSLESRQDNVQHWFINPASTAPSQIVISSWSYEKAFSVSFNFLICKMEILIVIHPGPDTLECEIKWALGNTAANKARGGDGISAELFEILKDDAIKVLHSICQQIWKTQQWPQD